MQKGFTLIELMIVITIIGVLAAISIPTYIDYTAKVEASEAFILIDGMKSNITTALAESEGWMIPNGTIITGKYVDSIVAGGIDGAYTLVATYKGSGVNSKVMNNTVTFTYNNIDGTWACETTLGNEIRPKSCR